MAAECSAHRFHAPRNLTVEMHHVVPQAWQAFWAPAGAPAVPSAQIGLVRTVMLWDDRTVALCPTGHRNVHALIVRMMRAAATTPTVTSPTPTEARHLAKIRGGNDAKIAYLALQRWVDAGGSLRALAEHGLWGEA